MIQQELQQIKILRVSRVVKKRGGYHLKKIKNQDIRELIKSSGYANWEVAEYLMIGESTFSRLLRKELPPEQKQELINNINRLRYVVNGEPEIEYPRSCKIFNHLD